VLLELRLRAVEKEGVMMVDEALYPGRVGLQHANPEYDALQSFPSVQAHRSQHSGDVLNLNSPENCSPNLRLALSENDSARSLNCAYRYLMSS
jgi:hypothetical protein